MIHENEFALLRETFKKSWVAVSVVAPESPAWEVMDVLLRPFFANRNIGKVSFEDAIGGVQPQVVYRLRDHLSLHYIVFAMTFADERKLVVIGPYAEMRFTSEEVLEISEKNGISPQTQKPIDDFFASVPVIPENSALFLLLDAFCERLWHGKYQVVDVHSSSHQFEQDGAAFGGEREIDDTFLTMKNMERRYSFENELMDAVVMGFEHKAVQILSSFADSAFEKRLNDPVRNLKNYGIIMNTLLRKAAERGGVHPVYLDKISSRFAVQIEALSTAEQIRNLMTDMFRDYCKLVKKHTTKGYSPIVKRAVVAIESDPSAEMNLHVLAEKLRVSNGYLSTIFKKETGKTVTQYIREKRLSYAEHLLKSTNLQIQTVALHCGMVDVQYFSKLFKRHTGKTPSQFREERKMAN